MVNARFAPGQLGLSRFVTQFCCSLQSPVIVLESKLVLTFSPVYGAQSFEGRDSKFWPGPLAGQSKAVAEKLTRKFIHPLSLVRHTQIAGNRSRHFPISESVRRIQAPGKAFGRIRQL